MAAPMVSAFRQALREAWANGAGFALPFAFFTGTGMLAAFALGGIEKSLLSRIGPGILWLALALASFVTLERVFQADLEDGALDLWILDDTAISAIAAAKVLAHWLISGLPLALFSPVFALMFNSPGNQALAAIPACMAGSLAFFLWGGFAAALSAGVARGGLLIALVALPFYLPTLIFGVLFLRAEPDTTAALFLAASTLFALGLAPPAMGIALTIAAD